MYIYRRASQRSGKLMTNLLLHKSKSAFKCFLEKQKMKRIDFEIEICFPLILDSLFIFVFGFGIRGAAIATVISQFLSAAYVLLFLEKKAEMKARLLKKRTFRMHGECKKYYQPGYCRLYHAADGAARAEKNGKLKQPIFGLLFSISRRRHPSMFFKLADIMFCGIISDCFRNICHSHSCIRQEILDRSIRTVRTTSV